MNVTPFSSVLTNPLLLKNLTEGMGFANCTPIQAAAIPTILAGKNLFGGARTGSGKTVAFLAPLCERLLKDEFRKILVLSPVRELALQIDDEAMKLLEGQKAVVSVPLYGGVPVEQQLLAMRVHKPRLYIATPGRIIDLVGQDALSLSEVDAVVLDEADRMCDMGFAPQVTEILSLLRPGIQTLLFSATLPKELTQIMENFCKDPERIVVDNPEESSSTIKHEAILVSRRDKGPTLERLMASEPNTSGIIFAKTRDRADEIYSVMKRKMNGIGIIHAGYSMGERERTIREFKEGNLKWLIATDVLSRGIDVSDLSLVIHFDLPPQPEDYIHRSGRSGRAGRDGRTIAFVEKEDSRQKQLIEELKQKIEITWLDPRSFGGKSAAREDRQNRPERGPQRDRSHRGDRQRGRAHPPREGKIPHVAAPKGFWQKTREKIKNIFSKISH